VPIYPRCGGRDSTSSTRQPCLPVGGRSGRNVNLPRSLLTSVSSRGTSSTAWATIDRSSRRAVSIEGEPVELPPGVDLSAYRIVQEALTNALKHAGPATARVIIRYRKNDLELEVADTGRGGTPAMEKGHGLVGMRERVSVYGGKIEVGSRDGGGFTLRACLPLDSGRS
jgi:two-component sensor histidine kinase